MTAFIGEGVAENGKTALGGQERVDRLLIGVTGSIAVLNVPAMVLALRQFAADQVRLIMTRSAVALLPASTAALFCDRVIDESNPRSLAENSHVADAEWASMFIVLPATANVLGDAAHGLAPSYLASAILAARSPLMFFPNMNLRMWANRAVQRNVSSLREDGHVVVEPRQLDGYEVGTRSSSPTTVLPSPRQVVALVLSHFSLMRKGASSP